MMVCSLQQRLRSCFLLRWVTVKDGVILPFVQYLQPDRCRIHYQKEKSTMAICISVDASQNGRRKPWTNGAITLCRLLSIVIDRLRVRRQYGSL